MRNFVWCPQEGMVQCIRFFPEPHAHIIIRSPGALARNPPCMGDSLYLEFWDLDPETINKQGVFRENPVRQKELLDGCMQDHHAGSIAHFVKNLPENLLLVVNCEAGVSRSPGVVLALRRFYGGDEEEVFKKAIPNMYVTSMVTEALRG